MNVGDWTDNTWVTLFQESAESVLEQTSETLDELKNTNPEAYQQVFQQATFKSYVFRMRVQLQSYNVSSLHVLSSLLTSKRLL